MNDIMKEIYTNILKYKMRTSLLYTNPYMIVIYVGFDGSKIKYELTPNGPVRLLTQARRKYQHV